MNRTRVLLSIIQPYCFWLCWILSVGFLSLTAVPINAAEFFCPSGDALCLLAAINQANQNGQDNTISLESGIYSLSAVDNNTDGFNAFPPIVGKVTIKGSGTADDTVIERSAGAPIMRIFDVSTGGILTLDGLTVRGGVLQGGAVYNNRGTVNIIRSSIYGNGVEFGGGGIFNLGNLTITSSNISGNATTRSGGGVLNGGTLSIVTSTVSNNDVFDGSSTGAGAGIANTETGTAEITDTALIDNIVILDAGSGAAISNAGIMTIINSTIARNTTNVDLVPGEGGGVFNTGRLTITNSTITHNEAGKRGGGLGGGISNHDGTVTLANTILALNAVTAFAVPPFNPTAKGPECFGVITSMGNNVVGDPSGCDIALLASDITGDPEFDAFADNGVAGNGHLTLLETSPAIDAGNNEVCLSQPSLSTDQIGEPRIGICDIGAIEFQPASSVLTVILQVKPGSQGTVNPKNKGAIPVAILSTESFDATTIDIGSVRFGAGQALVTGKAQRKDVNGDGQSDIVLRFRTQDSGVRCGDNSVLITGETVELVPIQGSAAIRTVGCKSR